MRALNLRSVIIGILGTVVVFSLMGSGKDRPKNLGNVVVRSITVVDDKEGSTIAYLGPKDLEKGKTRGLQLFNTEGSPVVLLGSVDDDGILRIYDKFGEEKEEFRMKLLAK